MQRGGSCVYIVLLPMAPPHQAVGLTYQKSTCAWRSVTVTKFDRVVSQAGTVSSRCTRRSFKWRFIAKLAASCQLVAAQQ
ncbi:hypothetical protein COO60DRAFT_384475 [Scenedesmus sp. NREL 46B-D3]|nr:hypothetical protein COO60DRAFT_384475 [Scenedesmus sp. NREL 46B-D3]